MATTVDNYIHWLMAEKLHFNNEMIEKYNFLTYDLFNIPFTYSHPMDENREADGLGLRSEFEYYNPGIVLFDGEHRPCSVLEFMVALACRCEDQIMRDPKIGDRTSKWFLEFLDNLELSKCTNQAWQYDYGDYIKNRIDIFLKRRYLRNGKGGLFPVKTSKVDQRNVQIWEQLSAYLSENYLNNLVIRVQNERDDSRPKRTKKG